MCSTAETCQHLGQTFCDLWLQTRGPADQIRSGAARVQTCNQTHLKICDHFNSLRAYDPTGRRGLLSILTRLPKLDVRPNLASSVRPKLIKLVLWECFHATSMSTQIQLRIPGPVSALVLAFKS